jgi:hypothetical protein
MRHETKIKAYKGCAWSIMGFLAWLLFLFLTWALVGCKSIEYVPVVEHKTDTTYITKNHRDSIYVHDSTYIHERGDTVWIERWHTRWRDRLMVDTIYQATHDTIPKPYVMLEYTDKPLSAWQKLRIFIGDIAIFATLIIMVIFLIKRKFLP